MKVEQSSELSETHRYRGLKRLEKIQRVAVVCTYISYFVASFVLRVLSLPCRAGSARWANT